MRTSCNGCRILRKGCSEDCIIRPCLESITSPDSQANATLFLAKFYGRAGLINLLSAGPPHLRPAVFRSLLYDACGRVVEPVHGATGLMISGQWHQCQLAVDCVMRGLPIVRNQQLQLITSSAHTTSTTPTSNTSSPRPPPLPLAAISSSSSPPPASFMLYDIRHVSHPGKDPLSPTTRRHDHRGSTSCRRRGDDGAGTSRQILVVDEEQDLMSTDTTGARELGCSCGGQAEYYWSDDRELEAGGDHTVEMEPTVTGVDQLEESMATEEEKQGEKVVGLDLTLGFKS